MAVIKTLFVPAPKEAITNFLGITRLSECFVDGFATSKQLEEAINPYLAQGYELFSLMPINSGGLSYKAGYSFTEGVVVVLKQT